jgi:cellulose synthase/poly-beta-1,6-N-acetylglucosamine synthase-like glycosyltransferase
MFCRFFLWKRYSEGRYWNVRPKLSQTDIIKLAAKQQKDIPFFSILIPARNEAQVIEKTVKHMLALNYPKTVYEIIVVTDEKEALESERTRPLVVQETLAFMRGKPPDEARRAEVRRLTLGVLSELALREYRTRDLRDHAWLTPLVLTQGDLGRCRDIIATLASDLVATRGRLKMGKVYCLLRRAFPECADREIARLYPNYLCLTLPVVAAYARLCGEGDERLLRSVVTFTTKANHRVTQDLLARFTALITADMLTYLSESLARGEGEELCARLAAWCFPTTQDVLTRVESELAAGAPEFKHVTVPFDYDGHYPGRLTGTAVPSTKGRALNYALARAISKKTAICGFYDAESRPGRDVLLYVAHKKLTDSTTAIWQGPVFQVRNFYEMGAFSKIASLYQAIAHDWYLPVVFRRLPFAGGTNLYVDYDLLVELKGYDHQILTEDLELGTRAYLATGAWPEYLPYASSEQTPPHFRSFYKQRLRWGTGHLQVLDKVRSMAGCNERKARLLRQLTLKGPVEWSFYQAVTLLPPAMLLLYWTGNVDSSVLPGAVRMLLNFLSLVYVSFTFYAFARYYTHIDRTGRPLTWYGHVGVAMELCFLPFAAFFFPVPYTSAMVLKAMGRHPTAWTKTPRTSE